MKNAFKRVEYTHQNHLKFTSFKGDALPQPLPVLCPWLIGGLKVVPQPLPTQASMSNVPWLHPCIVYYSKPDCICDNCFGYLDIIHYYFKFWWVILSLSCFCQISHAVRNPDWKQMIMIINYVSPHPGGDILFLYFLWSPSVCQSVSLSVTKSCAHFSSETTDCRDLKLCTMLHYH
jgi:hypothetical protein